MKDQYSSSRASQRQRILERLRHGPLNTLEARQELDVMHPAARVSELKEQGHNIVTHRTEGDSGKSKHRIACYVLLANQA
ncbi:MAG: helix-turn-helix domain-containing protein [Methylobacter sp.]